MRDSFDSIPEDREESFLCACGGNITRDANDSTKYSCDSCNWQAPPQQ
jgi:predicted RNA-binding Zn-ribbon protein involved in translation (DUF1610 family)